MRHPAVIWRAPGHDVPVPAHAPAPDGFLTPEQVRGHFDRAVAHWNAGRFWHAHEDWEDLWREAEGDRRLWLQGLIQYAAAFVHFSRGFHASGFSRLLQQATEKVSGYAGETHHLDWPHLQQQLERWIAHGRRVAAGADLVDASLGAPPLLRYVRGYTPAPLPFDPDAEEDE